MSITAVKRPCPFESASKAPDAIQLRIASTPSKSKNSPLIGTSFTATNQFGVKSYFIGTCHFVDEESFQNPLLQQMMNKSSALYSEAGLHMFNAFPFGTEKNEDPKYQHNPFRYPLDIRITEMAIERKISIISLDEGLPAEDERLRSVYQNRVKNGAEATENSVRDRWEKITESQGYIQAFTAWKKRDIPSLKEIAKPYHKKCLKREAHWAKTLLPKLLSTSHPISVAVGAAHLARTYSVLERCKRAGLKIELITTPLDI